MDAAAVDIGRNPVRVSTRFRLSVENEQADAGRDGRTRLSGANGDREIFIFPVQLTTRRAGLATLHG